MFFQPDTVLRWHREMFRGVWLRKSRPNGNAKAKLSRETVRLIMGMARSNRTWGAERIRDELLKLGFVVGSYQPEDLTAIEDFAGLAGLAVYNAQLVTKMERALAGEQQAREQAQRAEEDLRQFIDNLPTLAWTARPDGFLSTPTIAAGMSTPVPSLRRWLGSGPLQRREPSAPA